MSHSFPTLKPFYYLDHFHEVIRFVEKNYGDILVEEERNYLVDFRSLSQEAQALLVRMANRKGACFRIEKMSYTEIKNPVEAVHLLKSKCFLSAVSSGQFKELLESLTKLEISSLLKEAGFRIHGGSQLKKSDLISRVVESGSFEEICAAEFCEGFVVLERLEILEFIRFLFFGKTQDNFTAFALRDLGIVKTRKNSDQIGPRFRCREVAYASFFLSRVRTEIAEGSPAGLLAMVSQAAQWPSGPSDEIRQRHSRCLYHLGKRLEREGEVENAESIYRLSAEHPCRERLVRLLYRKGEVTEVKSLLNEILESPSNDEELLFGQDFYARKFGEERVSSLTQMLRESEQIQADESMRDSAERAAISHYEKQGWEAFWVENHFWSALFGIVFWDELQSGASSQVASEFDHRPVQLLDGSFYRKNSEAIEAKLRDLERGDMVQVIDRIFENFYGVANGVFRWRKSDCELFHCFLARASLEATANQLRVIAQSSQPPTGFPDLLLLNDEVVRFVEIKGEGDQLQRHQLAQICSLRRSGFDVSVARVHWAVDPEQEYVVVDVETTGARAMAHRVTEIGAVKVVNGKVTETFQTLIHPDRPIPEKITRITGISDAMVKDAPRFQEIAAEFRAFLGDAVFVAHNAKFDYGFLKAEFTRLGESLRCPTLCTVVAMRKYYPGLESYSLGHTTR